MNSANDWADFCLSRDKIRGMWYRARGTIGDDYAAFIEDYNAGVPRAIEFMIAYAKYKMTR